MLAPKAKYVIVHYGIKALTATFAAALQSDDEEDKLEALRYMAMLTAAATQGGLFFSDISREIQAEYGRQVAEYERKQQVENAKYIDRTRARQEAATGQKAKSAVSFGANAAGPEGVQFEVSEEKEKEWAKTIKLWQTTTISSALILGASETATNVIVDNVNKTAYLGLVAANDPSVKNEDGSQKDISAWLKDPRNAPLYRYGQGWDREANYGLITQFFSYPERTYGAQKRFTEKLETAMAMKEAREQYEAMEVELDSLRENPNAHSKDRAKMIRTREEALQALGMIMKEASLKLKEDREK
jgi:hypothetical protein